MMDIPPTEIPLTFKNKQVDEGTDEKDILIDGGYGSLSMPERLLALHSTDNELRGGGSCERWQSWTGLC